MPQLLTEVYMRITKIEITNYKSIKEPVEINYYNGLPTVLIGKNGSGKTNILEALSAVAEANGNYFCRAISPVENAKRSRQINHPLCGCASKVIPKKAPFLLQ